MKLLNFFLLFLLLISSSAISYREFKALANEKNWKSSKEAYTDYTDYCKNTALIPPNYGGAGMTPGDCTVTSSIEFSNDHTTCTITQTTTTTQSPTSTAKPTTLLSQTSTVESTTSVPQTSTLLTAVPTDFTGQDKFSTTGDQTLTSTKVFKTSTQTESSTSSALTTEESRSSSSEPSSTTSSFEAFSQQTSEKLQTEITTKHQTSTIQRKSFTSTVISTQSKTTTDNLATERNTKSVIPFIQTTTTTTTNDELKTSVSTDESTQPQTSTPEAHVSSSINPTEFTTVTSPTTSTKGLTTLSTSEKTNTFSSDVSSLPSTSSKITPTLQSATSTTKKVTTPLESSSSQKSTESHASASVSTTFKKSITVSHTLDTTRIPSTKKAEKSTTQTKSSTFLITTPSKKYTTTSSTSGASTAAIKSEQKTTFFDTTLSSSTVPSSTASSTEKTNEDNTATSTEAHSLTTTTPTPTTTVVTQFATEATFSNVKTETQSPTSAEAEFLTSTTSPYSATTSSTIDFTTTQTPTTTITSTQQFTVSNNEYPQRISATTEMSFAEVPEVKTTESYVTVAPPLPTTSVAITTSSTVESQITTPLPTTSSTPTESDTVRSTTTSTSATTTTSAITETATKNDATNLYVETSTTFVPPTTAKEATTNLIDETSTASIPATTKIQSTTIGDQTTSQHTNRTKSVPSETPTGTKVEHQTSPKPTFRDLTVPSVILSTIISDFEQSTVTQTKESDAFKTTDAATTSPQSEKTETSTEVPFDPSTDPAVLAYWGLSTSTETPLPPTKTPACKRSCPYGFYEGENACFKFFLSNQTNGWEYSDFEKACDSKNGIIATMADFGHLKTMKLFNKMAKSPKMTANLTFVNIGAKTMESKRSKLIPAIEIEKLSPTNIPIVLLKPSNKYLNASVVCRVGKYCTSFTCPINEFFLPVEAKFLEAAVPPTTVLKTGEILKVVCSSTEIITEIKCDRRGFLTPHSSFLKCYGPSEAEIETNGTVKSCDECNADQTASCDIIENGTTYYCNCTKYYSGKTCQSPFNACSNVTCQNDGTCINKFSHAYCECKAANYGDLCQYLFYSRGPEDDAYIMQMILNLIAGAVVVEQVVREKKRFFGKTVDTIRAKLPTEVCRNIAMVFGTFAFIMKIAFEFPDSEGMESKYECERAFEISMVFAFLSLSGMIAESYISLGILRNKITNQFENRYKMRKNCVNPSKMLISIFTIATIPIAIIFQNSGEMVTPRSCIGILIYSNTSDAKQMAGLLLIFLFSVYALTASCIALFARQYLTYNSCETRRRYDAEFFGPYCYGREIVPVEIGVKWCLLALKPIFFALSWLSAIAATELLTWQTTYIAAGIGGIYTVIGFLQNSFTLANELDSTTKILMNWCPRFLAPKYNYVSLWTRDDYLRILDPAKFEREQIKKLKNGPEVTFPLTFPENVLSLTWTGVKGKINQAGIRRTIPTGIQQMIIPQWTLIYLRARGEGRQRSEAMAVLWTEVINRKTYNIDKAIIIQFLRNFWANMKHQDQLHRLEPEHRHLEATIIAKGIRMLEIKPLKKSRIAEIVDPESSTFRNLTILKNDPPMNYLQQREAYNKLEKLCHRISPADMAKSEIETQAFIAEYPYLNQIHRDILSDLIIDNRRTSLLDFLLNETRPNFIGPRTVGNQLAPGIIPFMHITYFMVHVNIDTWNRIVTRSKYEQFYTAIRTEYNLGGGRFWPWNWFRQDVNPNIIPGFEFGELPVNPEEAHDPLDPLGLN